MEVEPSIWHGRKVLVTGHTGFKGAWLTLWLERLGAQVSGLSLPAPDDQGAWSRMGPWPNVDSHHVDLRDQAAVSEVVGRVQPEIVLHLAAQAIVHEGYRDPVGTYATNVVGTINLLEALRAVGGTDVVTVVTSDKVYYNPGIDHAFTEADRLGGADPYSSSKACTELVVAAWRHSFTENDRPRLATARAGNVLGGGDQGRGRLGPDMQRAVSTGAPIRLRYPSATRPWQFVLDPLRGYLLLTQYLLSDTTPSVYAVNFGPTTEKGAPVREVVERMLALCGGGRWEADEHPSGPEEPFLRLDSSLARLVLGWTPRLDLDRTLEWTAAWWSADAAGRDLRRVALEQLHAYEGLPLS